MELREIHFRFLASPATSFPSTDFSPSEVMCQLKRGASMLSPMRVVITTSFAKMQQLRSA